MCRLQLAIAYAGLDRRFGDVRSRKHHIHRLVAMVLLDVRALELDWQVAYTAPGLRKVIHDDLSRIATILNSY